MFNMLCVCIDQNDTICDFFPWFFGQVVKKEGDGDNCKKPKRTKKEIEEAKQLKIKKTEEEEQSRWRWFEKHHSFHLPLTLTHPLHVHIIGHKTSEKRLSRSRCLKCIFTLSRSVFLSGGRKRNMRMEWNGGSWNTEDPTFLRSTSLCQMTSTSTMTVCQSLRENVLAVEHDITVIFVTYILKDVLEEGVCRWV